MIRRSGIYIVFSTVLTAFPMTIQSHAFAQQVSGAYVDPQHLGTWIMLKPGGTFDEMTPDSGLQGTYKVQGNLITFQHGGGGDAVAGPRIEGGSFQMRAEPDRLVQVEYPGVFVRIEHLPAVLAGEVNGLCQTAPGQTSSLSRNERLAIASLWTIQTAAEIYFTIDPLHAPGLTNGSTIPPEARKGITFLDQSPSYAGAVSDRSDQMSDW